MLVEIITSEYDLIITKNVLKKLHKVAPNGATKELLKEVIDFLDSLKVKESVKE